MDSYLTLQEALNSNRLEDFIAQAEAQGVEAANRMEFESLVKRVTAPLPEGQTFHSLAGDCLRET
jgi:hypothetical protein